MSVHRSSRERWEVRWRQGPKNRSRTFDRKADAERFNVDVRRISQSGGIVPQRVGGLTLGEFSEQWLERRRNDLAKKTLREYAATFDRHIDPFLGHIPLTELRPLMLDDWQHERLRAGSGTEAIAKASKLLSQILNRAEALELIVRNPARTLQRPKHTPRPVRPATAMQVEQIRESLMKFDRGGEAAFVSFLAYVGPRPMEALALNWSDIRGNRAIINKALSDGELKSTKTLKHRTVTIPEPVVQDLREWRLASGRMDGLVWRRFDGRAWRQHDYDHWRARRFRPAATHAGLADFVPYDLRHTAASLLIAASRPVTEVAAQLGHSAAESTRTYQHLIDEYRGQPIRSIDGLIRDARAAKKRAS